MRRSLFPSFTHRAWWWVFGLFIATPALALALLGLRAIRAGEIERAQGLRDQQAQLARLVDAALASAIDRMLAEARTTIDAAARGDRPGDTAVETASTDLVAFEVDERGVIVFPRERVFFGPFAFAPAHLLDVQTEADGVAIHG